MLPTIHFTDLLALAAFSAFIGAVVGGFLTVKAVKAFKIKLH